MTRRAIQILDKDKVRSRRLLTGRSYRSIAGLLGVSNRVISRIEEGSDQAHLDFRFAMRLADALGCTFNELLIETDSGQDIPDPGQTECGGPDECQAGDVPMIGALLTADRSEVNIDLAALALGWSRPRMLVALHNLGTALANVGQRLSWLGDYSVRLVAASVPCEVEIEVRRSDIALNGLDISSAELIHRVITKDEALRLGDWDAARRHALVQAGVLHVEADASAWSDLPIRLTDEACYALALDPRTD